MFSKYLGMVGKRFVLPVHNFTYLLNLLTTVVSAKKKKNKYILSETFWDMWDDKGIGQGHDCVCRFLSFHLPLSQHEVVRLYIGVHNADGMQLLHRVQNAGCQEHDQWRCQHLLTQRFGDVDGVLTRGVRPGEERRLRGGVGRQWMVEWGGRGGSGSIPAGCRSCAAPPAGHCRCERGGQSWHVRIVVGGGAPAEHPVACGCRTPRDWMVSAPVEGKGKNMTVMVVTFV